jgi:hypothetical protein
MTEARDEKGAEEVNWLRDFLSNKLPRENFLEI